MIGSHQKLVLMVVTGRIKLITSIEDLSNKYTGKVY